MRANHRFDLFQRALPVDLGTTKFEQMLLEGVIIDGRAGGVLIGRTLENGGISLIRQRGTELLLHDPVESFGFILNPAASTRNLNRVKAILSGTAEATMPPDVIPNVTRVIYTKAEPNDKFVWVHWSQTFISAAQTERHYDELTQMNDEANPFAYCDRELHFPRLDMGTEDGVV